MDLLCLPLRIGSWWSLARLASVTIRDKNCQVGRFWTTPPQNVSKPLNHDFFFRPLVNNVTQLGWHLGLTLPNLRPSIPPLFGAPSPGCRNWVGPLDGVFILSGDWEEKGEQGFRDCCDARKSGGGQSPILSPASSHAVSFPTQRQGELPRILS